MSKWILADSKRWLAWGRRKDVFQRWGSVQIDFTAEVPEDVADRADQIFLRLQPHLRPAKMEEKRNDWRSIYRALEQAKCRRKCAVVFHRNSNHPDFKTIRIQLMSAAIAEQIVEPVESEPGSPKASRYIPKFERPRVWVELRDRKTKAPLPIDLKHPVAAETQAKLGVVNRTNAQWEITIQPFDYVNNDYGNRRRIRPVHVAKFTDNFFLHGRIYGEHQEHGKQARVTIRFGNSRSAELDFQGFHPRALYHLEGRQYSGDPYQLWDETSPEMRLMAKQVINAALNARSRESTIHACNRKMSQKTKDGKWKDGKERKQAVDLFIAAKKTGLKFSAIYDLALKRHKPIAKHFGTDAGMKLMRMDSKIALAVLFHFASQAHPCLCVHDSFVVPESQEDELRRVMIKFYRDETGFDPVIK